MPVPDDGQGQDSKDAHADATVTSDQNVAVWSRLGNTLKDLADAIKNAGVVFAAIGFCIVFAVATVIALLTGAWQQMLAVLVRPKQITVEEFQARKILDVNASDLRMLRNTLGDGPAFDSHGKRIDTYDRGVGKGAVIEDVVGVSGFGSVQVSFLEQDERSKVFLVDDTPIESFASTTTYRESSHFFIESPAALYNTRPIKLVITVGRNAKQVHPLRSQAVELVSGEHP